ncbi:MAG: GNAT family N-acetyltransferase [Chloroflexi bacterium]|nr:GNAT family N-acetyltransferase [Chloroflexota bacterium]
MQIRLYQPSDKSACLDVFISNVPTFFADHEYAEFAAFLDTLPGAGHYLVVESAQSAIVGCGGYFLNADRTIAGLMWGMVHRNYHRQGLGRALLLARLSAICDEQQAQSIELDTSQHSYGFFATLGFQVTKIQRDGYAPGLDRYDMHLALSASRCAELKQLFAHHAQPT